MSGGDTIAAYVAGALGGKLVDLVFLKKNPFWFRSRSVFILILILYFILLEFDFEEWGLI